VLAQILPHSSPEFVNVRWWTSIRAVVHPFLPFPLQISLKNVVDFYLDRFFGGPGVEFCSGMELTRMMDLYYGGGLNIFLPGIKINLRQPREKKHVFSHQRLIIIFAKTWQINHKGFLEAGICANFIFGANDCGSLHFI